MGLLNELKLRFKPPRLQDPVFGPLLYMYIPRNPSRSYWEGEFVGDRPQDPIVDT